MTGQPEPGASNEDIAWSLHRLAVAWAADDVRVARELGVTPGDFLALKHVAAGDVLGPAELSRLLGMSTGSVNALVNRLTAAGHLQRRPHPGDGRRLHLSLTTATRDVIAQHYQERARLMLDAGTPLTPDERATVVRFLGRLD